MLWNRIRGLWNAYHCILAVVLTVLYWIFLLTISPMIHWDSLESYQRFILYNTAAVVGLIIAAVRGRSAAATLLAGGFINSHTLALKQTVCIGVVLLLTIALGMEPGFRHMRIALLIAFLGAVYVAFLICHLLVPRRLAEQLFSDEHEQRTLLVGPVDRARAFNKWIVDTKALGFGLRGSPIDGEPEEGRILHVARVSDGPMLQRTIRQAGIRQIILLEFPTDREGLRQIADVARKSGVRLLIMENLAEICQQDVSFFSTHGKTFVSFMDEPLEDPVNRSIKRTVDVLIGLPVVVFVLPPLCLVVKILQQIQSPGPLFHRETCTGLNNMPFRIFNFRTTRITPDQDTSKGESSSDLETYPIGSLLRKTSLDRFPEFLNVFLGHMSVIGPRPRSIIQNRRFSEIAEGYHCRAFVKPGITGLAQMSGYRGQMKNGQDIIERTMLDIKYIENWSLPLDFWILFSTMAQVVRPPKTA
jgi:lipopolysaccharide/colanic/teichoic acid biosynthesis glycosyltransferase